MTQDTTKKPRPTKAERIKMLEARLAKLKAGDKAKARKQDTRRKVMLGAFVALKAAKKDDNALALVAEFLTTLKTPADKALFGAPAATAEKK